MSSSNKLFEIIEKKANGVELSREEMDFMCRSVENGTMGMEQQGNK